MAVALLACGLPSVALAADFNEIAAATYVRYSMSPPSLDRVSICHGFTCTRVTDIALEPADHAALRKIMKAGEASPEAERRAVSAAGLWFDKRIAPETGTANHIARADVTTTSHSLNNFDCIDSSRNMTSLLLLLDELKLFRFHTVDVPVSRGYLINFQLPHATAVLVDRSGTKWAVDAWTVRYGQGPEIMPLARWMTED
jgi:hypothetical protein